MNSLSHRNERTRPNEAVPILSSQWTSSPPTKNACDVHTVGLTLEEATSQEGTKDAFTVLVACSPTLSVLRRFAERPTQRHSVTRAVGHSGRGLWPRTLAADSGLATKKAESRNSCPLALIVYRVTRGRRA